MTHHHHHDHDHSEERTGLSFEEKISKILDHWVKHNDDHTATYRDWAGKAKDGEMPQVAGLIEEAAEMTLKISEKFEEAARLIK